MFSAFFTFILYRKVVGMIKHKNSKVKGLIEDFILNNQNFSYGGYTGMARGLRALAIKKIWRKRYRYKSCSWNERLGNWKVLSRWGACSSYG